MNSNDVKRAIETIKRQMRPKNDEDFNPFFYCSHHETAHYLRDEITTDECIPNNEK